MTTVVDSKAIPHVEGKLYELIVHLNGTGITGAISGGEILSATDGFNDTATIHALQASGCVVTFDDLSIVTV